MFIQTSSEGRIIGMMEATVTDYDGTVIEQDTTGYVEVDLPDDFDQDHISNYLYKDGVFTYDEDPDLIAERERNQAIKDHQETLQILPDAVAELSETVSSNTGESDSIADAVAELSELVSQLIVKEESSG